MFPSAVCKISAIFLESMEPWVIIQIHGLDGLEIYGGGHCQTLLFVFVSTVDSDEHK
jgi:hypothetical protein